jgi:hypothetical protein
MHVFHTPQDTHQSRAAHTSLASVACCIACKICSLWFRTQCCGFLQFDGHMHQRAPNPKDHTLRKGHHSHSCYVEAVAKESLRTLAPMLCSRLTLPKQAHVCHRYGSSKYTTH